MTSLVLAGLGIGLLSRRAPRLKSPLKEPRLIGMLHLITPKGIALARREGAVEFLRLVPVNEQNTNR